MATGRRRKPAALGGSPRFSVPLDIVRPSFPDLGLFAERFSRGLALGQVTNHGPAVAEFEERLSAWCGAPAVTCCNGQAALLLMLRAAGITGGEVIVPAYTFSATPHAVSWVGARPVFADIRNLVIDPADAERRITADTVAILAVDTYGLACDYDALEGLGRKHGIKILVDSAPAFGTRVGGRPVGARGDAQAFSFHATKPFTTMEGGCVVSRDETLLHRAAALRNFGQVRGADCDEPGLNAKMMEVCALIGLEQLATFDTVVSHRVHCARMLRDGLGGIPGLELPVWPDGQDPVWLYFPVLVDPVAFGMTRDRLAEALGRENIRVRRYFDIPCHHLGAYAAHQQISLPETERVAGTVLALPVYNDMTEAEYAGIVEAIRVIRDHAGEVAAALA